MICKRRVEGLETKLIQECPSSILSLIYYTGAVLENLIIVHQPPGYSAAGTYKCLMMK